MDEAELKGGCMGPDWTTPVQIDVMALEVLDLLREKYGLYLHKSQIAREPFLYDPTNDINEGIVLIRRGIAKLAEVRDVVDF